MKSAVETLNPTRVKLTVEVPFDELKPSMDAAYKSIASQVTVPGFRKGKVPPRIIDQRFGRGVVIEEAVNSALPGFYTQAVQESEIRPLGQPEVDVTSVPDPATGGDLAFTAEVDVRPEFELPALDAVEVTVDDVKVADEQVEERLQTLRERFGSLVTVERPAAEGDFLSIDIAATIGDEEIDSVKGVSYRVGSGEMLQGMDDVLPGLSAGETTTFDSPLAGGERAGEDAHVTVTVQSVKERELPEADDEFAQMASEFDTLEELRASLSEQAGQEARYQQGIQARERLLEKLLEAVEIPVPEGIIKAEVKQHLEQEGKAEDDPHGEEVEVEARKAFKAQLLLDAIAEKEEVQVGQQELIEYLLASAQQYRMDPNEFIKAVDEAGQVPSMVAEVGRRKALAQVLERAQVKDESGNEINLAELFPASAEEAGDEAALEGEVVEDEVAEEQGEKKKSDDPTALPTL
ncbi:trigger factor [Kineosporia rhizophila]|uniref:trigger factor n=1 Tax=Kineosporia TaxID=49184 RepID=UPI001E43EB90|nr:trigger factor [Kineosporia sp. NBRC 101677]MCE0535759.1 trigger factor [Kineosporia rhizophila]GLY18257.1 trigger factor [Kineosporia sp. NBRC 101677]